MIPLDWSAIALSLLILSGIVVCAAVFAGARRGVDAMPVPAAMPPSEPRSALALSPFAAALLPVDAAVQDVLGAHAAAARSRRVRLEFAVQPDLAVRADPRVLRELLGDLVSQAIRRAPCGRVLVGAMRHGGRVQISVSDDGAAVAAELHAAALRDTRQLAALQGGTLDIEAYPGQGSTVVLRLPEPPDGTADRHRAAAEAVLPHAVLGARIAVEAAAGSP